MSGSRDDDDGGIAELLARRNGLPPPSMSDDKDATDDKRDDDPKPSEKSDSEDVAQATAARYRREMDALRQQTSAETQRANAEAQRARSASEELARSRRESDEMGYASVVSQIAALEAQREQLEASYGKSFETGDAAGMARISVNLGAIGARLQALEDGKTSYEAQRNAKLREPAPKADDKPQVDQAQGAPQKPWQFGDPSENFLRQRTKPARDWLEDHNEFFTNQRFFRVAVSADAMAEAMGIERDTRKYFDYVEKQLMDAGLMDTQDNGKGKDRDDRRADGGSRAPPSIAPGRNGEGRRARDEDIVVTPEDRYGAELCRMDPKEYVLSKRALQKSGEWPLKSR